jgi:hypothetical protein
VPDMSLKKAIPQVVGELLPDQVHADLTLAPFRGASFGGILRCLFGCPLLFGPAIAPPP